jgi:hypothetical protein
MKQRRRLTAVQRWFADHRRAILWSTASTAVVVVGLVALLDSWRNAALSSAVALGLWLMFAWAIPPGAADVARRLDRQGPVAALPSASIFFDRWRARTWRRALAHNLTNSSLSVPTQIEVVDLLVADLDTETLAELRPLAADANAAPELRLRIAAGLAAHDHILATQTYRLIAEDDQLPARTQFEAADLLYRHARQAGAPFLQSIVKSAKAPDSIRLQAAIAHAEGEPDAIPGPESASMLAYLVGESAVSPEVRIEAAQRLAERNPSRATRALWTLANDPQVEPDQRFAAIELLRRSDEEQAKSCYLAIAHDPSQPWPVRLDAAVRLGDIAAADGRFVLEAFLRDPDLDERTSFEVAVRKLTLDT